MSTKKGHYWQTIDIDFEQFINKFNLNRESKLNDDEDGDMRTLVRLYKEKKKEEQRIEKYKKLSNRFQQEEEKRGDMTKKNQMQNPLLPRYGASCRDLLLKKKTIRLEPAKSAFTRRPSAKAIPEFKIPPGFEKEIHRTGSL